MLNELMWVCAQKHTLEEYMKSSENLLFNQLHELIVRVRKWIDRWHLSNSRTIIFAYEAIELEIKTKWMFEVFDESSDDIKMDELNAIIC
jgi:uncharacterized protein YehS (DUF1456 family)